MCFDGWITWECKKECVFHENLIQQLPCSEQKIILRTTVLGHPRMVGENTNSHQPDDRASQEGKQVTLRECGTHFPEDPEQKISLRGFKQLAYRRTFSTRVICKKVMAMSFPFP